MYNPFVSITYSLPVFACTNALCFICQSPPGTTRSKCSACMAAHERHCSIRGAPARGLFPSELGRLLQFAVNPFQNALRDSPRHISSLIPRLVIGEFYHSGLVFEDPADGFLAQAPQVRNLVDRIVFFERIARGMVLNGLWQFPSAQSVRHGIHSLSRFYRRAKRDTF